MEPPLGPGATGGGFVNLTAWMMGDDSQLGWGRDQPNEKELESKFGPAADSDG